MRKKKKDYLTLARCNYYSEQQRNMIGEVRVRLTNIGMQLGILLYVRQFDKKQ